MARKPHEITAEPDPCLGPPGADRRLDGASAPRPRLRASRLHRQERAQRGGCLQARTSTSATRSRPRSRPSWMPRRGPGRRTSPRTARRRGGGADGEKEDDGEADRRWPQAADPRAVGGADRRRGGGGRSAPAQASRRPSTTARPRALGSGSTPRSRPIAVYTEHWEGQKARGHDRARPDHHPPRMNFISRSVFPRDSAGRWRGRPARGRFAHACRLPGAGGRRCSRRRRTPPRRRPGSGRDAATRSSRARRSDGSAPTDRSPRIVALRTAGGSSANRNSASGVVRRRRPAQRRAAPRARPPAAPTRAGRRRSLPPRGRSRGALGAAAS